MMADDKGGIYLFLNRVSKTWLFWLKFVHVETTKEVKSFSFPYFALECLGY